MDIHVYDTYVKAKDGHTMHFDVITDKQDHDQAIAFAKEWLATVGEEGATVTGEECQFCHTQGAPEPVENEIKEKVISSKRWKAVNSIIFFYYFSFLLENLRNIPFYISDRTFSAL